MQVDYGLVDPGPNEVQPSTVAVREKYRLEAPTVTTNKIHYYETAGHLVDLISVYGGAALAYFKEQAGIIVEFQAHLVIENRTYPGVAEAAFGVEEQYVNVEWGVDFSACLAASAVSNSQFKPSPKGCFFLATVHGLTKILRDPSATWFVFNFKLGVLDQYNYLTKPRDDLIYAAVDFKIQLTKIHEFVLSAIPLALDDDDNQSDTTRDSEQEEDFEFLPNLWSDVLAST